MLTKIIGTPTVITMSSTPQTVPVTTFEYGTVMGQPNKNIPATKIRIATNSQPAYVSFGTTATTTTSVMIPANSAEHFKIEVQTITTTTTYDFSNVYNTITLAVTATVSVLSAGTGGLISIVAVA